MSSVPKSSVDLSTLPPVSIDQMVRAVEKVKADDLIETPNISQSDTTGDFPIVELEMLVRMELTYSARRTVCIYET